MVFYFLIFLLVGFILFISPTYKDRQNYLLFALAVILILVAGLRTPGIDPDSINYLINFASFGGPDSYFRDYEINSFFEPAYYLIPSLISVKLHLSYVWVFLTFATIGVALKFAAIKRLTDFALLSVLLYYCTFFILHEMTQIRAGIASALILLSIPEIQKRNLLRFLVFIAIGTLFHYSMIIFLPMYFLRAKSINKALYLSLLFVPFILHFFNINALSILQVFRLGIISDKVQLYNDLLEMDMFVGINIFNILYLMQIFCCTVFILKSDLLLENNKYAILLVKVYCIAAASFVLFSNIPVIAFRVNELLGSVQIILMPFILYLVRPKYIALAMVLFFALLCISNNLIHVGLLKPYFAGF